MNIAVASAELILYIVILKYCSVLATSTAYSNAFAKSIYSNNILPLILTPYIENNDVETARSLSRVGPLPNAPVVPSYSGFFTVNKEYNSNLFFWFFPALNRDINAPFILWLQGGPGTTDLMGLFLEHGPYILYSNTTAGLREHTWAKEYHVLYVDNPVGAGFSFTDNEKGYSTNQDQITDNLYEFLKQFFDVFYEYSHSDLYICGESFGGKHVPYLGYKLHINGPPAEGIKFKGIAVGNGYINIHSFSGFANFLYQLGIVDSKQASHIAGIISSAKEDLERGEPLQALKNINKMVGYFQNPQVASPSYLTEVSGYEFYYDFLVTNTPEDYFYYPDYIQSPQSRRAIHVGNMPFHGKETVQHYLMNDIFGSSSTDQLAALMDDYKVLLYYGQLDLAITYTGAEELIQNLIWKYAEEYKVAERKIWRLDDDVAGYVKSVQNFTVALVRNAGHLVPHGQPKAALDLITRFIEDIPFS